MEHIRQFAATDVQGVADLFIRVFRRTSGNITASLSSYFERLYIQNPLLDGGIGSIVQEVDGLIVGFIGIIPLIMTINGRSIRTATAGNYMIDPTLKDPFAGVRLLRSLFSGGQDVTITDTANDMGRKMWDGLGSVTIPLYSMQWLRVIRPTEFALALVMRGREAGVFGTLARPLVRASDQGARVMTRKLFDLSHPEVSGELLTEELLLEAIAALAGKRALLPAYTPASLHWRLRMAEEKEEYGPLEKLLVRDRSGAIAGWYMYHPNRSGIGQVLSFMARPNTVYHVLDHLLWHARERGSVALMGRAEPRFVREFSARYCLFLHRGSSVQVKTNDAEVINALHSGNALYTRFEGEWWTRLQGDEF